MTTTKERLTQEQVENILDAAFRKVIPDAERDPYAGMTQQKRTRLERANKLAALAAKGLDMQECADELGIKYATLASFASRVCPDIKFRRKYRKNKRNKE